MSPNRIQVLLVDDEESLRYPLASWLAREYGYDVKTAATGLEALTILAEQEFCFDVVLLDYLLSPPYTGITLMEEIKHRCTEETAFILFTGWGLDPQIGIKALKSGAYRYLAKPFDREELAILIQAIVGTREFQAKVKSGGSQEENESSQNPYIVGAPVPPEKFYGRQQMLQKILVSIKSGNHVAIYGERRIGKTSLLHRLEHLLKRETDPIFIPLFIQMQMLSEEKFFGVLVDAVLKSAPASLRGSLSSLIRQISSLPYEVIDLANDLEIIVETWQNHLKKPLQLVFLLDEGDRLNEFSEATQMQLRGLLQDAFINRHCRLVWCGIGIDRVWRSDTSPWFNLFKAEFHVDSLKPEEAKHLILEPVANTYIYEDNAVVKILELTRFKPYSIQRLCSNCIDFIQEESRRRNIVTLQDVEAVWVKNQKDEEEEQVQIQNAQSRTEFDLRLRQREYLLAIIQAISTQQDLSSVLELILQGAMGLLLGQAGVIVLYDDDNNSFSPFASIGLAKQELLLFEPLWRSLTLKEGQIILSDISQQVREASIETGIQLRHVIALPVELVRKSLGCIFIFRAGSVEFGSNDRHILSSLTDVATIAIQIARSQK